VSSPVSSLFVGDRLISRCDDGLLEAEFALFDRSEVLLSTGAREEGYMTRAGFARARLYEGLVTSDLAYEAFSAVRGRHLRPLARSGAVREIVDQLGPYETFQGGRFVAARGRYAGLWLDLDALAAACPLRDASILFQALHLVLVLEEVNEDAPVRLLTSPAGAEQRTWRRVDLQAAQRLPWVLREMQAPTRAYDAAHDEAEVREEILRDLRGRGGATAEPQPRLSTLAAAIARTGSTAPPPDGPTTKRMSSGPAKRVDSTVPRPRSSPRPPPAPVHVAIPRAPSVPDTGGGPPADPRAIAQSLTALVERPPFVPGLGIQTARAWLAVGEHGYARYYARRVVDDPNAPDDLRILALEILDSVPKTFETGRPPAPPVSPSIQPTPVILVSTPPPPPAPPPPAPPPPPPPPEPTPEAVAATVMAPQVALARVDRGPQQLREMPTPAPQAAVAMTTTSSPPPPNDATPAAQPGLDPRLILLAEPDSQRAASFRLLRDALLAKKFPRIIAVSSGAVHEGKTTCAINLALALSEKPSTRVLLMDGNFFAPTLGGIFHIDASHRPDPATNVAVLAPYRIAPILRGLCVAALVREEGDPPPAFNSRWFDMVIDHLAGSNFDHLVIDTAALDGSPAVTQVLGVAEGTLLTARSHLTTARSLRRAAAQIPEGRALGVTLVDAEVS
jgi:Mrp family chromosome partitioning ATPase